MKRIGLALAAAGVVSVSGIGGGVASAAGPYESVTGAIKRTHLTTGPDVHFVVSAHDGPNGAFGTYHATHGQGKSRLEYDARVVCLRVDGNLASVGVQVTSSELALWPVGTYHTIRVIDNGNPASGAPSDVMSPSASQATPVTCDSTRSFTQTTQITGNVLVKDGS